MPTAPKSKSLCDGCRDNFYNGEGAAECWSFKKAEVVRRWKLGWWTAPTQPAAFVEVETLNCHHAPGRYALSTTLPDFAIAPRALGATP